MQHTHNEGRLQDGNEYIHQHRNSHILHDWCSYFLCIGNAAMINTTSLSPISSQQSVG